MGLKMNKVLSAKADMRSMSRAAMQPGRNQKNFFETRVTEYQTGGALSWD
jgi:hypothetical protein